MSCFLPGALGSALPSQDGREGKQKGCWTNGLAAASPHPRDIHVPKSGLAMPGDAMSGMRGWGSQHGEEETATLEPTGNRRAQ